MDTTIIYENHKGERAIFGGGSKSLHYFEHELRNAQWSYTQSGSRTSFYKDNCELSFPVGIAAETEEEGLSLRNELARIAEKDVVAGTPGKIIIGGSYLSCFIFDRTPSQYHFSDRFLEYDQKLVTSNPYWITEHVYSFPKTSASSTNDQAVAYPYNYPYNYGAGKAQRSVITNESLMPCDLRLRIFGPAYSPSIVIAGNTYRVDASVPAFGRIEIDSRTGSVLMIDPYGNETNAYNLRQTGGEGSGTYIFERVPSGQSSIGSNSTFGYELTLFERSSEPEWE